MSEHENKTNEELIDLIDELKQSNESLRDEIRTASSDNNDYDKAILELSTIAEKSFYAGRDSDLKSTQLKSWLNYKMEERI
ncbi:MAG: hypothetical protein HRU18_14260 [Pseudoalteromonas sp.]|uniref:hypothetical protein n=1 Tax=Pseudoalteromonas sp. TaxID=53249 RepID=UPI001DEB1FDA|nr:hypothetical protein [Pseudoalteromonas sp.]NRA79367.1 hypothetical protein [Pseudoalteromonas sp.]